MGNFQRDDNRGGGFRGGNRGGNRGPVTMYKAVCDECHKNCEVPFRPSGDKPIYCSDCFSGKRGNDNRGPKREFNDRPAQSSFAKPVSALMGNDMSKQLNEMNSKLDHLINAIEKLSQPKVVVKTPVKKVVVKKKK